MLPTSALYRAALPMPHRRETWLRVFHGGAEVTPGGSEGVPITAGSVSASLNGRVTRSATFATDASFFPRLPTDLLSPYRAVVQIWTGIGYGDGTRELFPVFTGRIQDATLNGEGEVTFRGDDLASDVIGMRFERPANTIPGNSIVSEIQRFILQVLPAATFAANDVIDQATPRLIWDDDRGKALDELAAAVQGRWYALGDGSFAVRRYPYQGGTVVLSLSDGTPDLTGGGLITDASVTISRDGVANSVTVISERIDGSPPILATARDIREDSPTEWGDLFGRIAITVRPQTPLSVSSAGLLAVDQLGAVLALAEQWSVSIVPDAALEPGDTVDVSYRGLVTRQIIDSITYPLTTAGTMTLGMRGIQPDLSGQLLDRTTEVGTVE